MGDQYEDISTGSDNDDYVGFGHPAAPEEDFDSDDNESAMLKSEHTAYSEGATLAYSQFMEWCIENRGTHFGPRWHYFPNNYTFESFTRKPYHPLDREGLEKDTLVGDDANWTRYTKHFRLAAPDVCATFKKRYGIMSYTPMGVFELLVNIILDMHQMFIIPVFKRISVAARAWDFENGFTNKNHEFEIEIECVRDVMIHMLDVEKMQKLGSDDQDFLKDAMVENNKIDRVTLRTTLKTYDVNNLATHFEFYFKTACSIFPWSDVHLNQARLNESRVLIKETFVDSARKMYEGSYRSLFTKDVVPTKIVKVPLDHPSHSYELQMVLLRNMMDIVSVYSEDEESLPFVRCSRFVKDLNGITERVFGFFGISSAEFMHPVEREWIALLPSNVKYVLSFNPLFDRNLFRNCSLPEDRDTTTLSLFPRNHVQIVSDSEYSADNDRYVDFTQVGVLKVAIFVRVTNSSIHDAMLKRVFDSLVDVVSHELGLTAPESLYEQAVALPFFKPKKNTSHEKRKLSVESVCVVGDETYLTNGLELETSNNVALCIALSLLSRISLGKYKLISAKQISTSRSYRFASDIVFSPVIFPRDKYIESLRLPMDLLKLDLEFVKVSKAPPPPEPEPDEPENFTEEERALTLTMVAKFLEMLEGRLPEIVTVPEDLVSTTQQQVPKAGIIDMTGYRPVSGLYPVNNAHVMHISDHAMFEKASRVAMNTIQELGFPFHHATLETFQLYYRRSKKYSAPVSTLSGSVNIDTAHTINIANVETLVTQKMYDESLDTVRRLFEARGDAMISIALFNKLFLCYWIGRVEDSLLESDTDTNPSDVTYHIQGNSLEEAAKYFLIPFGWLVCYIFNKSSDANPRLKFSLNGKVATFVYENQTIPRSSASIIAQLTSPLSPDSSSASQSESEIEITDNDRFVSYTFVPPDGSQNTFVAILKEQYGVTLLDREHGETVYDDPYIKTILDVHSMIRGKLPQVWKDLYPEINSDEIRRYLSHYDFHSVQNESNCRKAVLSFSNEAQLAIEIHDKSAVYLEKIIAIAMGCVQIKILDQYYYKPTVFVPVLLNGITRTPEFVSVVVGFRIMNEATISSFKDLDFVATIWNPLDEQQGPLSPE